MVLPKAEHAARLYRALPEPAREAHVSSLEKYRELYRRSVEEPQGEWQAVVGEVGAPFPVSFGASFQAARGCLTS